MSGDFYTLIYSQSLSSGSTEGSVFSDGRLWQIGWTALIHTFAERAHGHGVPLQRGVALQI